MNNTDFFTSAENEKFKKTFKNKKQTCLGVLKSNTDIARLLKQ